MSQEPSAVRHGVSPGGCTKGGAGAGLRRQRVVTPGVLSGVEWVTANAAVPAVANMTYAFTAKATDTSGNVATSATVNATTSNTSPPTCSASKQLLGNPGFETGSASPWTATDGVINGDILPASHSGSWKAYLNGYGFSHTDWLYQQVTIPADACTAILSFWGKISTEETTTTSAPDKLTITVHNASGTVLRTLATVSNLNKISSYVQLSFNLADFRGQTVWIQFRGIEDSARQTSFILDDVAVNITQ